MKKLFAVAMVCLAALGAVAAQDWRTDEENGLRYNCGLVNALVADFGEEAMIRTKSGARQVLADFLNYVFPLCVEQDRGRLSEMIESDEERIVVVLYDEVKHAWGEPECSILIDDFYDEDFTFLSGGRALDGIAVDVYLPGENQPVVMDDTLTSVTASGLPIRRQWLQGADFPLGEYVFDVYIEGEIFHFVWDRRDNAMNTFSLVCHPHEEEADSGEADGETAAAEASDDAARSRCRRPAAGRGGGSCSWNHLPGVDRSVGRRPECLDHWAESGRHIGRCLLPGRERAARAGRTQPERIR